jgi:hypothetical protein
MWTKGRRGCGLYSTDREQEEVTDCCEHNEKLKLLVNWETVSFSGRAVPQEDHLLITEILLLLEHSYLPLSVIHNVILQQVIYASLSVGANITSLWGKGVKLETIGCILIRGLKRVFRYYSRRSFSKFRYLQPIFVCWHSSSLHWLISTPLAGHCQICSCPNVFAGELYGSDLYRRLLFFLLSSFLCEGSGRLFYLITQFTTRHQSSIFPHLYSSFRYYRPLAFCLYIRYAGTRRLV